MQQIMRMKKFNRSGLHGLQLERNRTRDDKRNFAYSDIDKERTDFNFHYKQTKNWNKEITKRLKSAGVKVRKDSNVLIGAVFQASADYYTPNPNYKEAPLQGEDTRTAAERQKWLLDEKTKRYFDDCVRFYIKHQCGGDHTLILDATIDMDEKTPHLQIYSIPLVKRENGYSLSAKEIFGDRTKMRKYQDLFFQEVGQKRGFERGELVDWDKSLEERKKHQETRDYKRKQEQAEREAWEQFKQEKKEQAKTIGAYIEKLENKVKEIATELKNKREARDKEVNELERTLVEARQSINEAKKDLQANMNVLQAMNDEVEKLARDSRNIYPKEYGKKPAKKNLKGEITHPATIEVELEAYERLKEQRPYMPRDSWDLRRIEDNLNRIEKTLDQSAIRELQERLTEAEENVRSERQGRDRAEREIRLLKDEMESFIEGVQQDPTIGYTTAQKVSKSVQDILDGVEQEQERSHTYHHRR